MDFNTAYLEMCSSDTSRFGYFNVYLRNAARMERFQPKMHTLEGAMHYAKHQAWYLKRELGV